MSHELTKLTALRTVYPPISSANAERLAEDPDVEELLRRSDFYMIAGRSEAVFENMFVETNDGILFADVSIRGGERSSGCIQLHELPEVAQRGQPDIFLEMDEQGRGFRVWDKPEGAADREILEWFTPDKLLWDQSRGRTGINGFEDAINVSTFDLLYVGIATRADSFQRLFRQGHRARQRILSNEFQRYPGSRPSDEIFLFMYYADPLVVQQLDPYTDFKDEDLITGFDRKRIVSDAEKAFVSLLRPEYNIQRFDNYPASKDGLFNGEYDRYGYVIAENIQFRTPHGSFMGGVDRDGMINNAGDFILVEGESVVLFSPNERNEASSSTD